MKQEYDALLVSQKAYQAYPVIPGLTKTSEKLPNVFTPYKDLEEHERLIQFLNYHDVKSLSVLGMNAESLEFVEAVNRSFPEIKVNILDFNQKSMITEQYGPGIFVALV
mgnify:CR=1 FL=1